MLRLLAYGAGQDDIVLVMHSDRKDHLIMNYAQGFDRLPIKEQEATALFVSWKSINQFSFSRKKIIAQREAFTIAQIILPIEKLLQGESHNFI